MHYLDNLSLKKKLYYGFATVVFLLICVAAFSVARVSIIGQALREQNNVAEQKLAPLYIAREALDQTGIAARNAYIFKSDSDAARELAIVDAQKSLYLAQLALLDKQFANDALFSTVRTDMATMAKELERPRQLREAGEMDEFARFLVEECSPLRRRIVANIATLLASVEQHNRQASATALEQERSAITWIGIASGAALLIAIMVAAAITGALLRQLGGDPAGAVRAAASIAEGDLQREVNATGAHPNSLMYAMRTMHDNLHEIVAKVRVGSDSIHAASAEIASGNVDLSNRTEAQAISLEKVSLSMKELLSSVGQNAADADRACAIATKATAISEEGGRVVAQVVQTMAEIKGSSQRIAEIVGVIDGIAFQTNILALNAAVEAARAGEQGRGFAVVAAEVRNLAQRSAAAAKEVKTLIADSVTKVGDGAGLVEQAGATMSVVVSEIQRVSGLMSHISSAAQVQHVEIESIDHAIAQLDATTQQNAALVEQAAAAAQALQGQAGELTETVRVFKLEPAAGASIIRMREPARRALASAPHGGTERTRAIR